jgi:linoleate 8R-lipoxygenase/9,12-octadecadienoate 8-hydroperoxide 8R-isomerase
MGSIKAQSETVPPSEIEKIRAKIGIEFQRAAELISASRKPLPDQTGDGSYLDLTPDTPEIIKKVEGTLNDLTHLGITDIGTLLEVQSKQKSGALWDDKDYLMEKLIRTATGFPDNSTTGKTVTDGFLTTLYNDLQHPPISYLGKNYQYRSADGSFNSLKHPDLGKAKTPYARTVAPKAMQPGALPDAGVIFDSIMARKPENRKKHPNQISSILFYTASIIIHDLFRTDHKDFSISNTSSYLDLSPLYGSDFEEQMQMRTGLNGKIKPDCFSEVRLLSFPPGVGVLLVMFNRFHQHVVEQLAIINEGGRFNKPKGDPPKIDYKQKEWWKSVPDAWRNYDEDLFQVGRLVTSGLYINIILLDYVRTILNLNKTNSNWALNPRADIKGVEVASGNQVSAEFNLVYRWHSAISERDEKWTEEFIKSKFQGMDPNTVPLPAFLGKLGQMQAEEEAKDPGERTWGPFKRQPDGTIADDDLVEVITASVEDCANSYGANRVPVVMRAIEILGIEQARAWSVASLNEFRKYFNLTPHEKFSDINPDPYVAKQLERLYDHPDQVELYPGMVVEESKKPLVPGAGLCPGYTVSRAVLSDAVALVRGDRFYTIDYHPKKLTNWGYSAVAYDTAIDNGCVSYKLFLTAFPHHFRPNSVYAHYPMTIPTEMSKTLKDLGRYDQYNFDKPARLANSFVASSYNAVKAIDANKEAFKVTWGGSMEYLISPSAKEAMAIKTGSKDIEAREVMQKSLYSGGKWAKTVRAYFEDATLRMLREKAYKLADLNQVDIIRDVGNLVPVHFVSELFSLPLKTKDVPASIFSEHEMYLALLAIYTSFLKDTDSINSFGIRQVSYKAVHELGGLVEAHVDEIADPGLLKSIMHSIFNDRKDSDISESGTKAIKALLSSKLGAKEVVWGHVLSTAAGVAATQGSLFASVVEYFANQSAEFKASLNKLAKSASDGSFEQLMHYVLEAARLSCETAVYRTVAIATTLPDGKDRTLNLKPGDKVLLNFRSACLDTAAFLEPTKFDPTRPIEKYLHLGMGPHDNLGFETTAVALTAMCKVAFSLDKLAPAKGPQGQIRKVPRLLDVKGTGADPVQVEGYHGFLTENWDQVWPVPQSKSIPYSISWTKSLTARRYESQLGVG